MKSYGLAAVLLFLACNGSPPVAPAPSSPDGGTASGPTEAGGGAVDGGAVPQDDSAPPRSPDAGSCAQYLGSSPASAWVYADANGKLRYKPLDANGDTIMDFSSAGYMGGGVALPTVSAEKTLTPSGEDDTSAIQA